MVVSFTGMLALSISGMTALDLAEERQRVSGGYHGCKYHKLVNISLTF